MNILMQAGDLAGLVAVASVIGSLPMHRGRAKPVAEGRRTPFEKELGPPAFEDFMQVWEGLKAVRTSEFYGLSGMRRSNNPNFMPPDRVIQGRVAAMCQRANIGQALERKLVEIARRRDEKAAERFFPRGGLSFGAKSRIMEVECKKVLKHLKGTGIITYGYPAFQYASHDHMLARAFSARMGKPNEAIVAADQKVVYEFFSLNVHQVATEQGRYELMKGCAEITTDSKLGVAKIKLFQRWGESLKQRGHSPDSFLPTDEEYEGNVFMQDDVVYCLAFKNDRGAAGSRHADHDHQGDNDDHGHASRRNMIAMVLSGLSRDGDGFHKKLTGGQLGQGIAGTVGILSAPCVFYRVGDRGDSRLPELIDEMKKGDAKYWTRISEGKSKESLNYEVLKWDSGFVDLLDGIDRRYKGVMSDLDVPMPLPSSEEEGGPEIVIGGH